MVSMNEVESVCTPEDPSPARMTAKEVCGTHQIVEMGGFLSSLADVELLSRPSRQHSAAELHVCQDFQQRCSFLLQCVVTTTKPTAWCLICQVCSDFLGSLFHLL
jgi:hypothetical protein